MMDRASRRRWYAVRPNVRAGMTGAMARVGAKLPGDVLVETRTLGGIDSAGMLCSGAELGLAESSAGILELPGTCEPRYRCV